MIYQIERGLASIEMPQCLFFEYFDIFICDRRSQRNLYIKIGSPIFFHGFGYKYGVSINIGFGFSLILDSRIEIPLMPCFTWFCSNLFFVLLNTKAKPTEPNNNNNNKTEKKEEETAVSAYPPTSTQMLKLRWWSVFLYI